MSADEGLPCDQCGILFASVVTLNNHVMRIHSSYEDREHKCDFQAGIQCIHHFSSFLPLRRRDSGTPPLPRSSCFGGAGAAPKSSTLNLKRMF